MCVYLFLDTSVFQSTHEAYHWNACYLLYQWKIGKHFVNEFVFHNESHLYSIIAYIDCKYINL